MGDRYFLTGVQLGMLRAFNHMRGKELVADANNDAIDLLLDIIEESQYIGKSEAWDLKPNKEFMNEVKKRIAGKV